jgi:hypothetical protein
VNGRTRGVALPLVVFFLLGLTILGHAALLLSRRELRSSWALLHGARAGAAAEAAAELGMRALDPPPDPRPLGQALSLLSGETPDGVTYESVLRWLDSEFLLLEGVGGSRGWPGERRKALVGWSLSPRARMAGFQAWAEIGGVVTAPSGGGSALDNLSGPPQGWDAEDCAPFQAALDSLFPRGGLPALGPLREPDSFWEASPTPIPSLGMLTGDMLLGMAEAVPPHPAYPPAEEYSLGCPDGADPALLGSSRSLELSSGRRCGILVVDGDLRLYGEARFQGLVLVGGDLVLDDGGVLEGMARVGGGIRLSGSGVFRGSFCPVFWGLETLVELRKPLFIGGTYLNGF